MKAFRYFTVLLFLASSAFASSTTFSGKTELLRYRWKAGPIKIFVSSSLTRQNANIKNESDVVGALRSALAAWSDAADVRFDVQFTDKQSVSSAGAVGDGASLLTISATPENVLLFSRDPETAAAKTRLFYNRKGAITEADIVLNPFQQFSTDGSFGTFDLQSIFTHEIGHLLGLGHSDVLGSVMLDNLAKNGSSENLYRPRELSDSDIAAARDVYGTADLMDDCCSVISGRLSPVSGKLGKGMKVWAEDGSSGRVVGQADVSVEGNFRMGGISAGTYRILARSKEGASEEIAMIDLGPTDEKTIDHLVSVDLPQVSLDLVGVNGQLAQTAIVVSKGSTHTLFISGKNLDPATLELAVTSKFLHLDPSTLSKRTGDQPMSVVSFDISVDPETPRGVYSLFASAGSSSRSVLIGALSVQ